MTQPGNIQRATHEGVLVLGPIRIECAVLADGTRVVSERAFNRALGRANAAGQSYARRARAAKTRADFPPMYMAPSNLKPVIPLDFHAPTFAFRSADNKTSAIGVQADVIPKICRIWVEARERGLLRKNQQETASAALTMILALSVVGIAALVDEACDYHPPSKTEYRDLFTTYIASELQPWTRRFPDEFFREVYRLHGWRYKARQRTHPGVVGHIINTLIYERMPPGVLAWLRGMSPAVEGRRLTKLHQGLTEAVGVRHLARQIDHCISLMRASRTWPMFMALLRQSQPIHGDQLELAEVTMSQPPGDAS